MVEKDIRIVIDATGSFAMLGKRNLPLYALHAVASLQQMRFLQQAHISVYAWQGDGIVAADEEMEDRLAHPEGTGAAEALCDFLSDATDDGAACLLLTDACFEQDDWQCLRGLPEHVRRNAVLVTMGADADALQAAQCFTQVYALCDLPGALQAALLLGDEEAF
ncbi:hypothetical protein [Mitsuokella jalaludinii]|uniref:hypothetical protein n=1 Tax=Mitsuokella jalaludinii TaxID=187979 RepID=UPI0022E51F61|nr:hypothetical protein [Mitsuokella jalaludinii]